MSSTKTKVLDNPFGSVRHEPTKKTNYAAGFTTDKGLILDLDNTSLRETKKIAEKYFNRFKLEGYLIMRSSAGSHHIIFNRYLTWKTVMEYLFKIVWLYHYYKHEDKPHLTLWAMLQACKRSETLRISTKKHKRKPRVVLLNGKKDKLIKDYLQYYDMVNENVDKNT
jgi:hypothetical protein